MPDNRYNQLSGTNAVRLAALSDGIFAVAMTLLVLELRTPATSAVHNDAGLWQALLALMPQIVTYLMSFLTLGIFWSGQQVQLNLLNKSDRHLSWLHLAFLCAVTLMPFSTRLLAEFIGYRTALFIYWANIFLLGTILYATWRYAAAANLLKPEADAPARHAVERRILTAQTLYAAGALLCFVNDYWSIAAIVAVQLNYAIAPKFRNRSKSASHGDP